MICSRRWFPTLTLLTICCVVTACGSASETGASSSDDDTAEWGSNGTTKSAGLPAGPGDPNSPGAKNAAPRPKTCPKDQWCSALYPPTWAPTDAPDPQGRFLHDFSYAGYRYGEPPPVSPPGATYNVVATYGADATGKADATTAIRSAISAASAAGGGIVFFPSGTYRVDQLLTVKTSGVVLRGVGSSSLLRFTKGTGMANLANVKFEGSVVRSAPHALVNDASSRAKEVFVADASDLAPGDDVSIGWTITDAFVAEHGMTGVWTAFTGTYQPFFHSTVVSVDTKSTPHRVVLDVPLRYAVKKRDAAVLHKETGYIHDVGIEHLGVTNAVSWSTAWSENRAHVIAMSDVKDSWALDVHSVAAPGSNGSSPSDPVSYHLRSGGVLIDSAKRVSVLQTSMENPQNRGGGGNGYLFEVSRTSDVLIADSEAKNGRHNFIQNWGFGNSGTVFLRDTSIGSKAVEMRNGVLTPLSSASEHHHSLAMATLVDSCRLDDGFRSENRGSISDGAGHTATESVVWNATGTGKVVSLQYGWGYVIGTGSTLTLETSVNTTGGKGTSPEDFVEGAAQGTKLYPASLYEDQRNLRTQQ